MLELSTLFFKKDICTVQSRITDLVLLKSDLRDRQIQCIDCVLSNLSAVVTEVILLQFSVDRIVSYMFCGVSWPSVVNLTILNPNDVSLSINNFTFDCLSQIETLRLGLSSLESLDINA